MTKTPSVTIPNTLPALKSEIPRPLCFLGMLSIMNAVDPPLKISIVEKNRSAMRIQVNSRDTPNIRLYAAIMNIAMTERIFLLETSPT